jgi:hypothetical protein
MLFLRYQESVRSYTGLICLGDGKVNSNLANGNTPWCSVCDAIPSETDRNEGPFNAISDKQLIFPLSPIHFGWRAFEALLHIAYKQERKKISLDEMKTKTQLTDKHKL